ncbi:SPOR domain-containing protein [Endozoicomonas atrinae]|uniref:SPOR domain-containing protein n=1 Tax=Endozoicomonas atrinae TaxID=1333660 RepID=UPI003AFFC402
MDVNKLNPDYSSRDLEQKSAFSPDLHLDEEQEAATPSSFNRYKLMAMGAACLLGLQVLAGLALYVFYEAPQLSIKPDDANGLAISADNTTQEIPAVKDSFTELAETEQTLFPENDVSYLSSRNNFDTEDLKHQAKQNIAEVNTGKQSEPVEVEAELTELLPEPDQDRIVSLVTEAFSYERELSGMTIEQQESPMHEGRDHNELMESDAVLTSWVEPEEGIEVLPVGSASSEDSPFTVSDVESGDTADISDSQYYSYSELQKDTDIASDDVLLSARSEGKTDDLSQAVASISSEPVISNNVETVVSNDIERVVSSIDDTEIVDGSKSMNNAVPQWVLKVAAFKRSKNALTLQAELQKQGIESFIETVASENGELFRIYAGSSDSDFEAVKAMIKKEYGIVAGKVSPYKG